MQYTFSYPEKSRRIFTIRKESVVVISDIITSKGEMIISIWVNREGNFIDVDLSEKNAKTNFVASSYGRSVKGLIEYAVKNEGILYQNPETKKVRKLLARNGLQLSTPLKISNSIISISTPTEKSNKNFSANDFDERISRGNYKFKTL